MGQASTSAQGTSTGIVANRAERLASEQPGASDAGRNQADAERLIQIDQVGMPYLALLSSASKTGLDSKPLQLFP